jgi:hypothetical protein
MFLHLCEGKHGDHVCLVENGKDLKFSVYCLVSEFDLLVMFAVLQTISKVEELLELLY